MFCKRQRSVLFCIVVGLCLFGCSDFIVHPIEKEAMTGDSEAGSDSETQDPSDFHGTDSDTAPQETDSDGDSDSSSASDAENPESCQPLLKAKIRDFSNEHPDFATDYCCGVATGLVADDLGADDKPVFASAYSSADSNYQSISSAETFAQWYNTIDGVNYETMVDLPLTKVNDSTWEYRNNEFFPLADDFGFGNEWQAFNYSFTTEIHLTFVYQEGQVFTFTGDDDLWIFVERKLALDLGGVHVETSGSIDMDTWARDLGMVDGESYRMDIFHAERKPGASNFHVETNIACIIPIV